MSLHRKVLAKVLDPGAALAVAAIYFAAVERLYPFRRAFELDPDEGASAVLGWLVATGHPLYRETWSDHAPLFPHLLAGWFHFVGWDVDRGRILVLLFSALVVWALYDLLRSVSGHAAAVCGVLLLVSSSYFVQLGVSLMIGVPSIACAFLSAWALVRAQRSQRRSWIVASGLLMAVSLGIKLITGFLLPVFVLWVAAMERRRGRRPLATGALWLACAVVPTSALLLALVGTDHLDQLRAVAGATGVLSRYDMLGLAPSALADWPLLLLALAGTAAIVRRGPWELSIFPLWAAAAALAMIGYAPVWYHHYLLLSLPACPCAAVACAELSRGDRRRFATLAAAGAAALWLVLSLPAKLRPRPAALTLQQADPLVAEMRRLGRPGDFVVTDAPMFAFRAGLTPVPEIALISTKRIAAGDLTADDVARAIERRKPRFVVLAHRFPPPFTDAVIAGIRDRYDLVPNGAGELPVLLYARRAAGR